MLDLPRYLLGAFEIATLAGFALLGASSLRARFLPGFTGPPAWLAVAVLALAILLWAAELLGTVGLFTPAALLTVVALAGIGSRALARGAFWVPLRRVRGDEGGRGRTVARPQRPPHPPAGPAGRGVDVATLIALVIAAVAFVDFADGARLRLSTGMTGFDTTWYHAPFAAGFLQSGDTFDLHFIAPQFLAWFYPANAELFHAVGMTAFDRDILSPLLNLGWFAGCLAAAWCIGRPFGVAPWSLALGAVALSIPALGDQAGEARNDIVGLFFLLAAVAFALTAWADRQRGTPSAPSEEAEAGDRLPLGALSVVGLAAGLAAGTKLNFLLPCAVLLVGLVAISPRGGRWPALLALLLLALAGGGYWYLRNLVHTGNPLPWVGDLGPLQLPAPDQALGGREAHSVLGYLTDGAVWSEWFLPGLRDGIGALWPLLGAVVLAGLVLSLAARGRPALQVAGLAGAAALLAWLIAPTSASGPDGMPRGFESGLRYLAPALVLGMALLPAALHGRLPVRLSERFRGTHGESPSDGRILKVPRSFARHLSGWGTARAGLAVAIVLAAVAVGYPVQRHYLEGRYADPSFTTPGLNAAFKWAREISGARIATTSTRQYPLFGTDLSNRVEFVGIERPHGGFTPPVSCPAWRRALNDGGYDYVVTSRDRIEPGKAAYPPQARWTSGPGSRAVLRVPPTVIFQLKGRLDPSACR